MRLNRFVPTLFALLLFGLAAGSLHAQVTVTLSTTSNNLLGAQPATLQALVVGAPVTDNGVVWTCSVSPALSGACSGFPSTSPPSSNGLSSKVYSAPTLISIHTTVTITATSVADPTQSAIVLIALTPTAITILVNPSTSTPAPGATVNFSAIVQGTSQTAVTWSINSAVGTFSSSGSTASYTAPNPIPSAATLKVTATLVADPTVTGTATITLAATSVTISPTSATLTAGQSQHFIATVTNGQSGVTWSISPNLGTIDQSGNYTAPSSTAGQKVSVIATSVDDPTKSATATVTLSAASVSITPTAVTLVAGQSQQFTATVTNSQNGVVWSINPQVGSIDMVTGLYTAPSIISSGQKVSVIATSMDDATKSATATVTLNLPAGLTIAISPTTVSLSNSETQQFGVTLTNATNTAVVWSISPSTGAGTLDNTGFYMAPAAITIAKATITVQSVQDPTKTATATVTLSTTIGVGSGAPTSFLISQFQGAYNRNGFQFLTSLPPLGLVKVLGAFNPTAYVQEFPDANKTSGVKYALATGSPTTTGLSSDGTLITVYQIGSDVYGYYTTVGASTAGLPLSDTQGCPGFSNTNSCTWQAFDKNYALFVYKVALPTGTNFFIRNASTTATFNTEWNKLGGLSGVGMPTSTESATLTAAIIPPATAGSTYIVQSYTSGAIYALTSGLNKGTTHGVVEPFLDLYLAAGGPSGPYGLPIGEVEVFSTGLSQQRFEGGILKLQPGGGGPTGQLPVNSVVIGGVTLGTTITLALGNSVTLTATPYDTAGNALADAVVSWSSTNGKVIQVQANGQAAVVTATAGGTANLTASSGGVSSGKISFLVTSPCCQVGDGAPAAVQSAFLTAIARNKLSIQIPVASPAQRVGNGYIQMVQGTSSTPGTFMLAQADQVGSAYVVTGTLLTAYQGLGASAGSLGYPTSDGSTGGTQLFTSGQALAGNPVHLVSDPILTKWALLSYEAGIAGPPSGDAGVFSTFGANSGVTQNFTGGAIYSATAGPLSGKSFFVTGLILSTYNAAGGASGVFGMPTSDEFGAGGQRQQNFEGGIISYTPGAAAAQTQMAPKVPAVIVAPTSISAGGRARLAVAGFANGATIQVTVTGQAAFTVTTATGGYSWDMYIPLTAATKTLNIHAADTKNTASADGILNIRGFTDNRVILSKLQGDNQTAAPGALLPVPLQIALLDASGSPVSGATIQFQASGGVLSASSALTDAAGHASVYWRLPTSLGTAGVTASAPSIAQSPVTFFASPAASTLPNFPNLPQAGSAAIGAGNATIAQKGALLTAVASILRYHQNRSEVPSPNGLADPGTLNQFLIADCTSNGAGGQLCDGFLSASSAGEQVVNLWRAADFTGGLDVVPVAPTTAAVADLVALGEPILLSLSLSLNGSVAGGHFVVATGINSDGSIVIQDPSPLFARTNFNDYLNGFTASSGGTWKATLAGVVRFAVRSPSATRFLLGAVSQPASLISQLTLAASSTAGACGLPAPLLDTVDGSGNPPSSGPLESQFLVCDGTQSTYQINVGASQAYQAFVTDLAKSGSSFNVSGSAPASYQAARPTLNLVLSPLAPGFTASAVVNAATFGPGISPGGLFSIFGSGLSGSGVATAVDFDGTAATILVATPFQINAQVPASLSPGTHVLRVVSPYGTAQQTVTVSSVAPGIFVVGTPAVGAVENSPDSSLNTTANPLTRGGALVIYATGLGTVSKQGQFSVTTSTVTAILNGVEMPVAFAGLAPGYTGLYQINLVVPVPAPPGLGLSLVLKEAGQLSNTVFVSLQ